MNPVEYVTPGPMRREGLIDQAAEHFRQAIVSGRWPLGQKIPTEPALVSEFGIGRNTVREALQSLVHAGLLRREQGRGTFVISDSELTGTLQRQLGGGTRKQYLELRHALDSAAAALAAVNRSAEDVALLRELCTQRRASWAGGDTQLQAGTDLALHSAIVAATHNPLYVKLYAGMLDVFAAHMRGEETEDEATAHKNHHDLVEAIAAADPELATRVVARIFEPFSR